MSQMTEVGFARIPFHVLTPSGSSPDWDYSKRIVSEHIPGSDLEFTQVLGSPHARITVRAWFDSLDDYRRVKAMEGQWETLVLLKATVTMPGDSESHWRGIDYVHYGNVMLVSAGRTELFIDYSYPVECDLTFQTRVRL